MGRIATISEIKTFFSMDGASMMKEWRALSADEQQYFKEAVGAELERQGIKPKE